MDLLQTVRKEGSRGGRAEFKWEDVKGDAQRENYLGHSLMAPVGRWQQGRDLNWYAKGDDESKDAEAERIKEEKRKLKEAEEDAMLAAMGLPVPERAKDNANLTPLGQKANEADTENAMKAKAEAGEDEDRARRREKKERSRRHRDDDHDRRRRHRSRSRSRDRDRERRHRHRERSRSRDRRRHDNRDDRDDRRRHRSRSREHRRRDERPERRRERRPSDERSRSRSRSRDRRRRRDTRSRSPYKSIEKRN